MASDAQYDATCRRLQSSRQEIFDLAHTLKGDRPPIADRNAFPRSRLMRAITGERGRKALGQAALALAMSRPRTVWRLAGMATLLRPMILRLLAQRLMRPRRPVSTLPNRTTEHRG
jgi:hypothetical protein